MGRFLISFCFKEPDKSGNYAYLNRIGVSRSLNVGKIVCRSLSCDGVAGEGIFLDRLSFYSMNKYGIKRF